MYRVVVPARYGSTRLPGKPLLPLCGKPMIQWVYERALRSGAREVIIATDDPRIEESARSFSASVVSTAATHHCGTDRIAEVARRARWPEDDIIVNVQGDEPLMPAALIDQVAALLAAHAHAAIATLAAPVESEQALLDPNVVKVVTDREQRALYFSRAPIPWVREPQQRLAAGAGAPRRFLAARRHVGIYAYRVAALARLAALPPSQLEQLEQLEQLRALENGMEIRVADAQANPGPDVNTAADVARVEALLARELAPRSGWKA